MRTFHIGGTASSVFKQPEISAREGVVKYEGSGLWTLKTAVTLFEQEWAREYSRSQD